MTRSPTLSVKLFRHLVTTMPALVFGSALALGSAQADEAVELCSGGYDIAAPDNETVDHMLHAHADLTFWLNHPNPLTAGWVNYFLDNIQGSTQELIEPERKPGVILFTCRTTDRNSWANAEVLSFFELPPALDAAEFSGLRDEDIVQEGDYYALRAMVVPTDPDALAGLRNLVLAAAGDILPAGPLLPDRDLVEHPLNFALRFNLTHTADPLATSTTAETGAQDPATEPSPEPAAESAAAGAAPPPEVADLPLNEALAEHLGSHPQHQPLVSTVLDEIAFGPSQPDGEGYFSAPATAPVGSLIPIEITYADRHNNDNLILIDPDSPDDALTGPSGRNWHRFGDDDTIHRRAADWPGIYELRLRRHAGWDRGVIARSEIELVDIDIDLQVPEQVGTREEFKVYMNPVMDGHLVIVDADRDPDNLVGENARRNNVVEDAEGPGLIARTAPASAGDYEVRFHFNQQQASWAEHTHRAGRLMARAPLRVVDAAELEAAEPEAEAEAQDDQLAALEAQIAELSENLESATVAQADEIHDQIAALGLPALAMLIDLLNRDQITPQLVQVFTAPQSPAQWASTPAPAPASAPAAPAAAAPTAPTSQPVTAAPQAQAEAQAEAMPVGYVVTGVAADDVLSIRSGPGTENMISGMLPPNATGITPTGDSAQSADGGTWWQIADPALPGGTGWVNARFLAPAAQPAPTQPAPTQGTETLDPAHHLQVTGIAANEVLYLRSSPSPNAPIVGMLPPDATEIISTGATQSSSDGTDWVQIYHANAPDGGMAWADAAYLVQMDPLPSVAEVAQDFTLAPRMHDFDTFKLEQSIANILHYAQDSALAPGHGLSPLTKSIVALQAIDGRLPHARYHLTYGQGEAMLSPDGSHDLVDLIELRRFNLGPARHAETVAAHGAEHTADIAHFGEGPDVVWRFAMRPLRGNDAVILSAARAEIDTPEGDCMGFHCQMAQSIVPHMADWEEESSIAMPEFRPSYDELWQGAPSAPAVLDALALTTHMAEADTGDARWRPIEPRMMDEPGEPFAEVIIEVGMGQDTGAEVGFYETRLRDDEVMSVWYRLGAFGGPGAHHVIRSRAAERWPDRQ